MAGSNSFNDTKRLILETTQTMPAHPPPSYHTIVSPPSTNNPYDPTDDDLDGKDTDNTEFPEVTINATTQVRGHGNIISVPPMDAVRIAGLLHTMLFGPPGMPATGGEGVSAQTMGAKRELKVNISINCGSTVVGDRNVVGPGLGEVARQMQTLRAQQHQQQQQTQAQAAAAGAPESQSATPVCDSPLSGRSETDSGDSSVAGVDRGKRKAEEVVEDSRDSKRRNSNDSDC